MRLREIVKVKVKLHLDYEDGEGVWADVNEVVHIERRGEGCWKAVGANGSEYGGTARIALVAYLLRLLSVETETKLVERGNRG